MQARVNAGLNMTKMTTSNVPHSRKHIISFITDPFKMFMSRLGYPTGISAALGLHEFCNYI